MASNLSNTQGRIFWALPATGSWMTAAEVLAAAGLPDTARPRIGELYGRSFIVRQRRGGRADGIWEYQRAPMDFGGGE